MTRKARPPSVASLSTSILRAFYDANPTYAMALGFHRYDGRLPVLTRAAIDRRVARIRRDLTVLDRAAKADGYAIQDRLVMGALRSLLLKELFSFVDAQEYRKEPMGSLSGLSIVNYLLKNYAPLDRRLRAVARLQGQVPAHVARIRVLMDRRLVDTEYEMAEMMTAGTIDSYEHELPEYLAKASPASRRLVGGSSASAVLELQAFLKDLRTEYKPRVKKAFALGRAKYQRMLWAEHLTKLSIERLLEVGMADLDANKRAFLETAAKVDPGKDPRAVMEAIARDHPSADSLIPDTQKMLEDIRAFVIAHDLVTVPSEDRPTVIETPRAFRWFSAAMNPPGAFEKVAREAFYYVTPVEKDWPPEKAEEWLRYLNYPSLRNISVHECYPGHFVHLLHTRDTVRAPALKTSLSIAFTEGWAHYCEGMMVDAGFQAGDARYRMVQLQDALLRDCRYIASIRMHVYGWGWEEATRFVMENAFMDRLPAEREAKRGTFDPGYLNYTLGRIMIKKLRTDWMALHRGASLREFHDAFLALGAPPMGLAREALLGPHAGPAL